MLGYLINLVVNHFYFYTNLSIENLYLQKFIWRYIRSATSNITFIPFLCASFTKFASSKSESVHTQVLVSKAHLINFFQLLNYKSINFNTFFISIIIMDISIYIKPFICTYLFQVSKIWVNMIKIYCIVFMWFENE